MLRKFNVDQSGRPSNGHHHPQSHATSIAKNVCEVLWKTPWDCYLICKDDVFVCADFDDWIQIGKIFIILQISQQSYGALSWIFFFICIRKRKLGALQRRLGSQKNIRIHLRGTTEIQPLKCISNGWNWWSRRKWKWHKVKGPGIGYELSIICKGPWLFLQNFLTVWAAGLLDLLTDKVVDKRSASFCCCFLSFMLPFINGLTDPSFPKLINSRAHSWSIFGGLQN